MASEIIAEIRHVTKEFPGVVALKDVSLEIRKGEIHTIVGENGAGKSTLMKLLSGFYPASSFTGEVIVRGKHCRFQSLNDAEQEGIAIIFQELSLASNLSVAENIFLGRLPSKLGIVDQNKLLVDVQNCLQDIGLDINPDMLVGDLPIGKRQSVEIVKAITKDAKILILDEPTSSLSESEIVILMRLLEKLKARGVSCIYISHKLNEVFRIADTITVLRDGLVVGTGSVKKWSKNQVISMMVGRPFQDIYPKTKHEIGETVFEVRNLNQIKAGTDKKIIKNVSFKVRRGEILGISGLMGSGRTELLMGIFGAYSGKTTGEVLVLGKQVRIRQPLDAIQYGIYLVPEDRHLEGLVMTFSVSENLSLASLNNISKFIAIDSSREYRLCESVRNDLSIKTPSLRTPVTSLSGGNQQKIVIGKWLARKAPVILFLDEPTRGIDVGAKHEVYNIIHHLAKKGIAVVMVSSELPEVVGVCDRILVMSEGRLKAEFLRNEFDEEKIMYASTISA